MFGTFDPLNPPTFSRAVRDEFDVNGVNLLGRWSHTFSSESDLRLQLYYDRTERDSVIFEEKRDTFDIDFQHRFPIGERDDVVWGGGYRLTTDRVGNSPTISLVPDHRALNLFSAFVQDEIALLPERLRLTLGSKFEHNDFTGYEVQPSGRLMWSPHEQHMLWGSISRAVRTPSRAEDDVVLNQAAEVAPGIFAPTTIRGSHSFDSEKLLAYEIGYRAQLHPKVTVDLAGFYNEYDDLRSLEHNPLNPTQIQIGNKLFGETYGAEASATLALTSWWRLRPAYTFLEMQLHKRPGSTDTTSEQDEGKSPQHQFTLRSSMDLPGNVFFDCALRYVDDLPALGVSSYITLDARLAWQATKNLELSLVGQNLLEPRHREFSPSFIQTQRAEIQRGIFGKITLRF